MKIQQHAIENYLGRVLNLQLDMAGEDVWEFAEEQIELAVRQPEMTYQKTKLDCPVYIRNGVAIPVQTGDRVPSAYNAGVFLNKISRERYAERKPA